MKTIKYGMLLLACTLLGFWSCKEAGNSNQTTEPNPENNDQEKITQLEIDPATDPLLVGAEFVEVYSDTLNVQMYEMTMKPGDSIGLHVHPDHSVYVFEGGTMMLYINGTDAVEMQLVAGTGFVSGPLTDAAKNIGDTDIKLLIHEIYRPRQ